MTAIDNTGGGMRLARSSLILGIAKRGHIDLVGLFEPNGPYWYWGGVNPIAVIWTALGFLAYMFVIPAEWIRVVVTVIATGAGYWATIELLSPRFAQLARGSHAG